MPMHSFWLSPDETRAAVERVAMGDTATDLWLLDGAHDRASRFTTETTTEGHPVWSPDGRWIAYFAGTVGGSTKLLRQPSSGVSPAEVLVGTPSYKQFTDWGSDGSTLVFEEQTPQNGWDLTVLRITGKAEPTPILHSRFDERYGQLSPDGRFLAYVSNETGRDEVYVISFPDISGKWPISSRGGTKPRWGHDGGEIFFIDPGGQLMSARTTLRPRFESESVRPLFAMQPALTDGWTYAVSKSGDRFLVMQPVEDAQSTSVTVVLNWSITLGK